MATQVPPKKNAEFIFYIGLVSQADTKVFQSNPTLAAGDFKVSIDGGALANLNTLPDVDPDNSKAVKVLLSSSEMNGDNIQVIGSDASGAEWCDILINIQTTTKQVDDLSTQTSVDSVQTDTNDIQTRLPAALVSGKIDAYLNAAGLDADAVTEIQASIAALLTATVADSTPADGTRPSIASGILMITRFLMEKGLSGVTLTVNKEDGSTPVMTFTLDSAANPTSITRAS